MEDLSEARCRIWLKRLVEQKPLVHCITNFVSMDLMANCLCAIGASPAMVRQGDKYKCLTNRIHHTAISQASRHFEPHGIALGKIDKLPPPCQNYDLQQHSQQGLCFCFLQVHSIDEVEEFSQKADVLLVNVGTLSKEWLESMKKAVAAYKQQGKQWILDPVAAGATQFRTKVLISRFQCICHLTLQYLLRKRIAEMVTTRCLL